MTTGCFYCGFGRMARSPKCTHDVLTELAPRTPTRRYSADAKAAAECLVKSARDALGDAEFLAGLLAGRTTNPASAALDAARAAHQAALDLRGEIDPA